MSTQPAALSAAPVSEPDSEPDDRALVTAALAGDELAFRALYRRQTPRLRRLVQRLLGAAGSEADDVVQEVWLRAMLGIRAFRWESALASWVSSIAVRVVAESLRASRKGNTLELDDDVAIPPADLASRIDIEDAIARVPAHYRVVFVLHDIEGHTHDEIAAQLGIATGTSKSNLHRARRLMRKFLGNRFDGEST
jgi:RNA polymerase sigma-70 factor (ECF subfamily)